MTRAMLPKTFYIQCDGKGFTGYVYGKILPQDDHELAGRYVGFGCSGYEIKDGQVVEIYKAKGLFGEKFYLVDGCKTFKISMFEIR